MKFILGDRGSGVTTDLVLEAAKFGGVIVCPTLAQTQHVIGMAKKMNADNVHVISIQDVIDNNALTHYPNAKIFISDIKYVLWPLLKEYGATGDIETVSASMYMSNRMDPRHAE